MYQLQKKGQKIMEQKILAYLKEHETEIFEDLKSLVLTEASTSDIEALAKVREKLVMLIKSAQERTALSTRRRTDTARCGSSMERVRRRSCSSVIMTPYISSVR